MATLQGWQIFLIVLAGVLALLFIVYQCICVGQHMSMPKWCKTIPFRLMISSMNIPLPPSQCLKCVLLNRFNVRNKIPSMENLELRVKMRESGWIKSHILQ
jgi:hypothetical protein